jgi:enoyl-CoA hydratase
MIEVEQSGSVSVLTMAHGKANALDIELCDAMVAQFNALHASPT